MRFTRFLKKHRLLEKGHRVMKYSSVRSDKSARMCDVVNTHDTDMWLRSSPIYSIIRICWTVRAAATVVLEFECGSCCAPSFMIQDSPIHLMPIVPISSMRSWWWIMSLCWLLKGLEGGRGAMNFALVFNLTLLKIMWDMVRSNALLFSRWISSIVEIWLVNFAHFSCSTWFPRWLFNWFVLMKWTNSL